jgi:RNA polymerase sigma-70 factor (ECF subfamily)
MTDRAVPGSPGSPEVASTADSAANPAAPSAAGTTGDAVSPRLADLVELVTAYSEPLYRYAYRLSGSAADAEDLTQQVFLVAHQKLDQLRCAECARGWLFSVLRNCYLKGRRGKLGLTLADVDVNGLLAEPPATLDSQELQEAINQLDDDFKVVVLAFYFENLSYREIAERLNIPLGTVMSRLARAKAHLRRRLHSDEQLGAPAQVNASGAVQPFVQSAVVRH